MSDEERDVLIAKLKVEAFFDDLGHVNRMIVDAEPHEEEAAKALIQTTIESSAKARQKYSVVPGNIAVRTNIPAQQSAAPLLSAAVNRFLNDDGVRSKKPMLAKHKLVLPLLLEVIGDKPIDTIEQTDIVDLFSTIRRLPTQWPKDLKKGLTIDAIIDSPNRKKLSEETFNAYYGSIQTFLGFGLDTYPKHFPPYLNVKKQNYNGDRKKGKQQKQRAFSPDELRRIFEGPEMKEFAADPALAHKFWLPHIGLFTGARINEICQINPQTDIRKDKESGIWYFLLTEETEAHEDVKKSIKTDTARKVPIHKKLIDLGLLGYVERVKTSGGKMLFPDWKPRDGRAASNAGAVFIDFLKKLGIHGAEDEEGFAIRGAHAFRFTLISYGKAPPLKLNLRCITGHKERTGNTAADGYEDDQIVWPLAEKKSLLDQLDYGIHFHQPAKL